MAYDLGNGRVLKKWNSWPIAFWVILKNIFPFKENAWWRIPQFIYYSKIKAEQSRERLERGDLPPEWFANPKFVCGLTYEQDKVTPLENFFEHATLAASKKIIDQFIIFAEKVLQRGVIEKSFNITQNFGLDSAGKIVLVDIGELIHNEAIILRQRTRRAWAKPYVIEHIHNEELRAYFIERMDAHFSVTVGEK